jgi:hypothetical protein
MIRTKISRWIVARVKFASPVGGLNKIILDKCYQLQSASL